MTPQERKLIEDLAAKLAQTQVGQKDTEAEDLIQREIGSKPDSVYKLVQTALVQNMAIDQAHAQIADLQQKAASAQAHPAPATSFLGSLFGSHSTPPPAPPPPQRAYQAGPAGPPPPQAAPQYAQAPYAGGPPPAAGGGSSFLRSAATTAAGVAAGALAFEGIESLLHGGIGGGGFGHQGSGFLGSSGQPGETVINNYYDRPDEKGASTDTAGYSDDPVNSDTADTAGYTDDPVDDSADQDVTDDDSGSYDDSSDGSSDDGGGDDSFV